MILQKWRDWVMQCIVKVSCLMSIHMYFEVRAIATSVRSRLERPESGDEVGPTVMSI